MSVLIAEDGGKTAELVSLVPGASFLPGGPPAPLEDYAGACIAAAGRFIGVNLGFDRVTLQPDSKGANFTTSGRDATLFVTRGVGAYQQFFQVGRACFMAVATRELGGMSVIPGRAWPKIHNRAGMFGLWPHEMLAALFQVEMLQPVWAPPLESYRTVAEWGMQHDPLLFGNLYRLGVDLQAAVGQSALFKLGNPKYVRDRWFVEYEEWLATLPNAAANNVVGILERHYRQWITRGTSA